MRNGRGSGAAAIVGALLVTAAACAVHAHHPVPGKFESAERVSLTGIVTRVDWRNPHAHVFVDVERDGSTQNWAVELESPIDLERGGWRPDSVEPGDRVTVAGPAARNGSQQVWGESLVLAATGRRVLDVEPVPPSEPLEARPAPRWPDGRVALGATSGSVDGYWGYPDATALVEDGVDVEMDRYGLLADLDDASRVAPLKPWALGVYRHRQARSLRDDPLWLHCKPPGGPRQFQYRHGVQLIEDRANERIFVLMGSGNRNYRIIHLDGRDHVGQVEGDDDNPLYYGRSVGRWEDDTLVVDTRGFNEDFWFTQGGLPHTGRLTLTERFSRPDHDTLRYEVTIDDPGTYTRPWTASWNLHWVGGETLPAHFCQHNRP